MMLPRKIRRFFELPIWWLKRKFHRQSEFEKELETVWDSWLSSCINLYFSENTSDVIYIQKDGAKKAGVIKTEVNKLSDW